MRIGIDLGGTKTEALALGADGVFLSNGPGDPAAVAGAPEIVRRIAVDRNNTADQNARLFALVNAAMGDAGRRPVSMSCSTSRPGRPITSA